MFLVHFVVHFMVVKTPDVFGMTYALFSYPFCLSLLESCFNDRIKSHACMASAVTNNLYVAYEHLNCSVYSIYDCGCCCRTR